MKRKLKICKIIDQYGWAYYFTSLEQQRYSIHDIDIVRVADIGENTFRELDTDILYIPSPDIVGAKTLEKIETQWVKNSDKNIKIIGAYSAEIPMNHFKTDLIISISARYYSELKKRNPDKLVIFIPEGVDTNYFTPEWLEGELKVGWAGSYKRPLKRTYLLDLLDYPVKIQCDREFFEGKTLEPMKEFYHSINCLVLTSLTECMPRVVLEAMACGLPIISTDVGSIRMLLDKDWIVPVNPDTKVVEEINKKLYLLGKYPALRKEVGERNRKQVERYFSWENNQILWDNTFSALYYENYSEIITLAEEFYSPFEKDFPTIIERKTINEFLLELIWRGVLFWVEGDACLDTICFQRIGEHRQVLEIGVKNKKDKEYIEYFAKMYQLNFEIKIKVSPSQMIKLMPLNKKTVGVPFPVVNYLIDRYGQRVRETLKKLNKL